MVALPASAGAALGLPARAVPSGLSRAPVAACPGVGRPGPAPELAAAPAWLGARMSLGAAGPPGLVGSGQSTAAAIAAFLGRLGETCALVTVALREATNTALA